MTENRDYICSSVKGFIHEENWDNILIIDESNYCIFTVFDGVSAARNGKEGTIEAKQFISEKYKGYCGESVNIKQLMYDANRHLISSHLPEPYTTYCLVYLNKGDRSFYYSWLGDSRIYLISKQSAKQLTSDDTYYENMLSKCLGDPSLEESDFRQLQADKNVFQLLICTDGFYKLFESNRKTFLAYFQEPSLPGAKQNIDALIDGKNYDDSTYIFVK